MNVLKPLIVATGLALAGAAVGTYVAEPQYPVVYGMQNECRADRDGSVTATFPDRSESLYQFAGDRVELGKVVPLVATAVIADSPEALAPLAPGVGASMVNGKLQSHVTRFPNQHVVLHRTWDGPWQTHLTMQLEKTPEGHVEVSSNVQGTPLATSLLGYYTINPAAERIQSMFDRSEPTLKACEAQRPLPWYARLI